MPQNNSEIRKKWLSVEVEKLNMKGITNVEIAERTEVKPQFITNITTGVKFPGEKYINKFCEAFNINQNNLFNQLKGYDVVIEDLNVASAPNHHDTIEINPAGIPLIPIEAVAGFVLRGDVSVMNYDIQERYLVPEFSERGVKFLVRVSGSSMYPKYSNGDILACRPITDLSFFQWGKVYVLDTDQGAIVKRLFEGKEDTCIECRSDNKEHYPAFQIPKASIRSVSIVVGVIRLD